MSSLTGRHDGSTDRLLHDFPTSNPSTALTPSFGLFVTLISYVDYFSPALAAKMAAVQTESPSPPSKVSDLEQIELGKPQSHISRLYSRSLVDSLAIRLSGIESAFLDVCSCVEGIAKSLRAYFSVPWNGVGVRCTKLGISSSRGFG